MRTAPLNTTILNAIPLSCISMSNQESKARPEIVNVNSNNPIFYPFSIKTNNVVNVVKVFNLLSRTNETRHIKWHETCKCECRLDAIVCNNK